nr:hypothetical protein [uncultured Sphingobacterium sp.]
MKKILLCALLSWFGLSIAHGQNPHSRYNMTDTVPSTVYKKLNDISQVNVEVLGKLYKGDLMGTLKPEGVKSVDVDKGKQLVIIELNQNYKPVLITLSDLQKKYTNVKSNRVIFMVDDQIVQQSPAEVFVDISNIMQIDVSPVKSIGDIDELYMINLWVRNEKNIKELNRIILR